MDEYFDTTLFISEVEKRPSIWDMTCPQYKDRVVKREHWDELVDLFSPDGDANEKKNVGE